MKSHHRQVEFRKSMKMDDQQSDMEKASLWAVLDRRKHIEKLINGLTGTLPKAYEMLVPTQSWVVYWITHSLNLLEQTPFVNSVTPDVIDFLKECADEAGGYGGGPGQIAHLATTFAAVSALISTADEEALDSIDRVAIVRFLYRMKQDNGSFTMHDDGEIDTRATYCALSIMRSLNIQDKKLEENVVDWILSCQTYEGGFGSVPGSEAHGGYTFCCVASLCLMGHLEKADTQSLMRWLTNKQLECEGGFCGRSNKLVDSCYSYWQGAVFPLLHPYLTKSLSDSSEEESPARESRSKTKHGENIDNMRKNWIFDCASLQDYILNQCQADGGLLRDKPGASPDFYHTCYALSGLSISQHQPDESLLDIGSRPINIVAGTHPLFNLTLDSLAYCIEYFKNKKIVTEQAKEGE